MLLRKKHRIIIDTNLWISFLLTNSYNKIDTLIGNNSIILLFSHELLNEFIEVSTRTKFKKYFSIADLEDLLVTIRTKTEFVSVTSNVSICRDEKDNFLLALAQDGNATYLLTGDNDLLVLKRINKTKIITISEYLLLKQKE